MIYKKILKLCQQKGVTTTFLARQIGVSNQSAQGWKNGSVPSPKNIKKIADYFNVDPSYFYEEDQPQAQTPTPPPKQNTVPNFENVRPIERHRIPLLGEIACGKPIFCNEDRESYVEVGTNIKADFCLIARGDSMINARINSGDVVFIRNQPMVENGEIAAVEIDGEATLKRVYYSRDRGEVILQAENSAYRPLVFTGERINEIHILGKAIAFQSDVK